MNKHKAFTTTKAAMDMSENSAGDSKVRGGCWAEGGGMDASDFYLQLIQPILGGNERLIQVGWPGEQWADGLWGYSTKNEINLHTQQ